MMIFIEKHPVVAERWKPYGVITRRAMLKAGAAALRKQQFSFASSAETRYLYKL